MGRDHPSAGNFAHAFHEEYIKLLRLESLRDHVISLLQIDEVICPKSLNWRSGSGLGRELSTCALLPHLPPPPGDPSSAPWGPGTSTWLTSLGA